MDWECNVTLITMERAHHDEADFGAGVFVSVAGFADAGRIIVAHYDHSPKKQSISHVVHNTGQNDDHIAPSILILPDGHLLVFWSGHCEDYIYMRRSVNPEDISCWGDIRKVTSDDNCCYTNPVYLNTGRIYLIYRDRFF